MINEKRLLNEFLELVKVDSETKHERAICDILKGKFIALGLDVVEDNAAETTEHEAGNLICTMQGNKEGADPIFFTCHMDTVIPGKGIQPSVEDGHVVTDGTTILGADDKAGIAAMLEGIRTIQEQKIEHGPLQFVITVGEESGLIGAKALNPEMLNAKYGFAMDSGGDVGNIIVSAPNQATLEVTVNGKTAHAGVAPEKGISAITVAAKSVAKMPLGRIDEETTANIGRFEGGQKTNIVTDKAYILAEARSLDRKKLDVQVEKMKKAFEDTAREMGASANVNVKYAYPGYKFDIGDSVVQVAMNAVRRSGLTPSLKTSGGGSDANIFSGYGIPTVNFAVGYLDIHTPQERMPISELNKITQLMVSVVEEVSS
ncbi:M20/M25/M40 family metallo-hydrolase [Bacillus sp. FJAT-44742]|uniref:M20/M25/M40 family metallo-hydrolase n=1 Tax=Bacillus sp. FJAT-44742 TaxID=2014005 RepID=UPI000C234516|nr:M20/M25/M40 family metallo-hydrolase [Bacillus sp. FJAT-44742]